MIAHSLPATHLQQQYGTHIVGFATTLQRSKLCLMRGRANLGRSQNSSCRVPIGLP